MADVLAEKHWLYELASADRPELLASPWLVNYAGRIWTFATNGRIAVMIPDAIEGVRSATGKPLELITGLLGLPFEGQAKIVDAAALKEWCGGEVVETDQVCNECGGTMQVTCPHCDGDGQVHCDACGSVLVCPECVDGMVKCLHCVDGRIKAARRLGKLCGITIDRNSLAEWICRLNRGEALVTAVAGGKIVRIESVDLRWIIFLSGRSTGDCVDVFP